MNVVRCLKVAAAVGVCLLPLSAIAQNQTPAPPLNELDIGAGWQSDTSYKYGRYNGMPYAGGFAVGRLHVQGGDAWDSGGTTYYDADANLMGWYNRSLHIKFGQQGTWGASFTYDNIPYFYSNEFHTVFGPGGGLIPGVAPGSISNVTTQLSGRLPVINIDTNRDIVAGNMKYIAGDWLIQGGIKHEHKQGYTENSLAWLGTPSPIINNGNLTTTALSYFAQPINYDTDRYDISATYSRDRLQAMFGYTYSQFTDSTTTAMLTNPFAFTTAAAGGPPANITGVYSLPPSNSAHQFKAQVGYNFGQTTRLNATVQYGLMEQNQRFNVQTGNGNAVGVIAPPGTSFDGLIETAFGYVSFSSMPLPKLDVQASYMIDNRANRSPRSAYPFYVNDNSARQTGECNSPNPNGFCANLPFSYQHQKAAAEAGYRVLPGTKLTVGTAFDATRRTFSNTNDTTEGSVYAKARSHIIDGIDGSIGYTHADRWAQQYQGGNAVFSLMNAGGQKDVFGFYDFFQASRRRDEAKAMLDLTPLPGLSATLMAKADDDYYPQASAGLGLKSNTNVSIGPDVEYQINNGLSVHAYYTYQRIFFDQSSLVTNAGCNGNGTTLTAGPGCLNNGAWTGKTDDSTHTLGAGADWLPMGDDKLKLSVDYTFDAGNISYTLADGGIFSFPSGGKIGTSTLLIQPLPPVTSTLNSVTLKGEYKITENMSLFGVYTFERFNSKDYANNVGATQLSNAVLPGELNANYTVHTLIAELHVRW
jgi:MtrB/PioB family decaheme-associated outer membrane protein